MFITKLALRNFRNHRNTAIEPAKLNIFVGPNNSGKSSILAAIEWGLTGRNLWTDRAGRGAGDLINREAGDCQVGLELAGLGSVLRAMPPHTLSVGKSGTIQESQAAVYRHIGADEQLIRLALNAGAWLNLPPAEQKAFLFALCGISCTSEEITAAATENLCAAGLPGEQVEEVAAQVQALLPRGFGGDPAILEGMEKRARELRRETKRDLERTRAALAELPRPNLPEGITLEEKAELAAQLAELETDKNELLKAYGARQAAAKNLALCRDKAEQLAAEIKHLSSKKNELERKAAACVATGDPKDRPEPAAEFARLKERFEVLTATAAELDRQLAALQATGQARQDVVKKLRAFDGRCPLAPELIACRLSGQEVTELANQLATEINTGDQQMQNLRADSDELQQQINRLAQALAELPNLEQEIERLQTELDSALSEADEWEEALRHSSADPEEIDLLQARILRGQELLRSLELAEHGSLQADRLRQSLKVLEQKAALAEHLVKALGPDGIRKSLLGDRLAGFTNEINTVLAACTEGRYRLAWQEDFTPLLTQNGQALPLRLLSKSEQFRVSIALQAAIAKLTGLKFLAVDEVDMLDQDNRDLLMVTLLTAAEQFDQIMLFCTVGEVQPQDPGLPGVKIFWVEDGQVSELGQNEGSEARWDN